MVDASKYFSFRPNLCMLWFLYMSDTVLILLIENVILSILKYIILNQLCNLKIK
jgi:hypothetical protein